MDDIVRIAFLLDFYGNLLTEKQHLVLKLHFEEDLSLSEIASMMGVSRAAVHDALKRGQAQLEEYESKLGLVARFAEQSQRITELKRLLAEAAALAEQVRA
ncbi:MAG: YlxM family DNA-binding protein [Bacillota bacterium]|jgi:hypothetical protein|nr:YlxM family DNA-binding protein [Bacillota bacterium]